MATQQRFVPKLFSLLKNGYSRETFLRDLSAGITVGIVALPLAIAFAIASGVKPEQGLYTAIIAGFSIALFGGSRAQVSGPTGAFVVVVYAIVQQHGYEGLAVATLIAGGLMIAMGLSGMGAMLKFIPFPVTVGFTSGIAVVIFTLQIRDLLGLQIEKLPGSFVEKISLYSASLHTLNPTALGVSLLALGIILFFPRLTRKVPASLVAILVCTLLVQWFKLPVETVASRFGEVPSSLPTPHFPEVSWALFERMFEPAITIALLGSIESLLSAVVADGMMGTHHRSNTELVAQGIGNVLSPIFLGIPATGAIARTATNIRSGAQTPVASLIHSLTLLFIMLFFGKYAALIPLSALAAVLVVVAYNMSEWRTFLRILKSPRSDVLVLVLTFVLTVLIDLTVAIEVGVVLAAFLFLRRMESTILVARRDTDATNSLPFFATPAGAIPQGVEVFDLSGPLFFGAVERFKSTLEQIESAPKAIVLQMQHVSSIDASGLHALEGVLKSARRTHAKLILTGVQDQPREAMTKSGFLEALGEDHLFPTLQSALDEIGKRGDPENE